MFSVRRGLHGAPLHSTRQLDQSPASYREESEIVTSVTRRNENAGQSVAGALVICSTSQRRTELFCYKPLTSGVNCNERVYRRDSKLAKLPVY